MEVFNIFELDLSKFNYHSFKNFEEYVSFMNENGFPMYSSFYILNTKTPKEYNRLDINTAKNNDGVVLNYTSSDYPVFYYELDLYGSELIIDPTYYENHKEEINKALKEKYCEENGIVNGVIDKSKFGEYGTINIPDYVFTTDEIKQKLLNM